MLEHEADIQDQLELEAMEETTTTTDAPHEHETTKAPVKAKRKKATKKVEDKPCVDCPDYKNDNELIAKISDKRRKGYNNNQIAAMLGIHKQFVDEN